MNDAVKASHRIYLEDGSTLDIGRVPGGYAVLSCCAETKLRAALDTSVGGLPWERVPEHMRLEGPNPMSMYIPVENSPIDILIELPNGRRIKVLKAMTQRIEKIPT